MAAPSVQNYIALLQAMGSRAAATAAPQPQRSFTRQTFQQVANPYAPAWAPPPVIQPQQKRGGGLDNLFANAQGTNSFNIGRMNGTGGENWAAAALGYLPHLVESAGAEAVGGLSGALGGDRLKGASVLSTLFNPKNQITGSDLISGNKARNITGVFAKYGGEGKGALGFQGSPALQAAGAMGTDVLADPVNLVAPAGIAAHGTEAVLGHISDAAGAETARLVAEGADQAAINAVKEASSAAQDVVRRGGVSALTKHQIGTINEWAGNAALKQGMVLKLPGGGEVPITPGGGVLGAPSVALHEAKSAIGRALLGAGDEGPTVLGRMFGGKNGVAKALMRGGGEDAAAQRTISRALATADLQSGVFAKQIGRDLANAGGRGEDQSTLAQHLLGLVEKPSGATAKITPELHDLIMRLGGGENLGNYARVAGRQVAMHDAAQSLVDQGVGLPSELSPQAAVDTAMQHQGAVVGEAQNNAASLADQAQQAREAAQASAAHPNPQAEAQSLSHPAGAPPAAPQGPAGIGSPAPSASAAQAPTEALPNTVGVPPSPQQQTLHEALAAAQAEPGNTEKVQAAVDAAHAKIQAVKDTLESNPNVKGAARYTTPYKVQLWAHARDLGIDTKMSAPRLEQTLREHVGQWEAGHAAASPALDAGRQLEAAQQAAAHSTVDQSHAALQAHVQQLQKKGVPNTPQGEAVVKASTQIDEAGLRAKDPAYEAQQQQQLHQQLHSEIASGHPTPSAPEVLHESQQWAKIGAEAADPKLQEIARINQVALDAGHAADAAAQHAAYQRNVFERLKADPAAAESMGQKIYRDAHDFAAHRSITPGIHTPNEAADALLRVNEAVTRDPGWLAKINNKVIRPWKTAKLMTPGFQSRLLFGHAFMNLLARRSFETYGVVNARLLAEAAGRDAYEAGSREAALWEQAKSLAGSGQAQAETGLTNPLSASARMIEGRRMPWEGGPSAQTSPLSKVVAGANKLNPFSTRNSVFAQGAAHGAEGIQHYFRLVMAHDVLFREGGTLNDAAAMIARFHFNYSDASNFDRVARNVVPFYTFMRNNVPLQVQMALENPKIAATVFRATQDLRKNNAPLAPGLALNTIAGPLTSAAQTLGALQSGKDVNKEIYGRLSPTVTGPAEWLQMVQSKNNAPTKLWGSGGQFASGKLISTSDLHIGWADGVLKTAGLAHTEPKTGRTYVTAPVAHLITKLSPVLGDLRSATSSEKSYANRRGATLLRLMAGIETPYPQPTPAEQAGYDKSAAYDAKKQAESNAYDMGVPYPRFQFHHRGPRVR